ncbi:MAG: YebC/PmpR family DNA-binding transcriptional regulator, partial [Deltaproteobacteria bacterium]
IAAGGAVSWDFARLGQLEATPPAGGADPDETAIEAGADDLEPGDDGQTRFFTNPTQLDLVSKALAERGWTVSSMQLIWRAKSPVTIADDGQRAEVIAFLQALDDDDDVQNVFAGLA